MFLSLSYKIILIHGNTTINNIIVLFIFCMNKDVDQVFAYKNLLTELCKHMQEKLQYNDPVKISFMHDKKNCLNPLGKTAYYDPKNKKIYIYITNRHIKDIMRSMCHEMVHHMQNCRGDLSNESTQPGYAQTNSHLRKMEEEAYLLGNMLFRDWTDKTQETISEKFNT